MTDLRSRSDDQFLHKYQPSELRSASEFLSTWLPFLSRDLCHTCIQNLSRCIRSLDQSSETEGDVEPVISVSTPDNMESHKWNDNHDEKCYSIGSWKEGDGDEADSNSIGSWKKGDGDEADTNSIGSWKDGATELSGTPFDASTRELVYDSPTIQTPSPRMSWADMAHEDELEEEEELEVNKQLINGNSPMGKVGVSNV